MAVSTLQRCFLRGVLLRRDYACLVSSSRPNAPKESCFYASTTKTQPPRMSSVTICQGFHTRSMSCSSKSLRCAKLSSRGLVKVSGPDATELLQGLMTNDTGVIWGGSRAMYAMFLNTQGRILFDTIIYRTSSDSAAEPSFLLECDAGIHEKLMKHLKIYRVRKKVDVLSADSELQTWVVFSNNEQGTTLVANSKSQTTDCDRCPLDVQDPRVDGFGRRVILSSHESPCRFIPESVEVQEEEYTLHRYRWGVPEGVIDLPPGEALPLEANLAYMNGVSFTKGCYLGQELTARSHHTGVIRKRIMPVHILRCGTSLPESGAKIISEAGKTVGKLRGYSGNHGLALLRFAQCKNQKLLVVDEDGTRMELSAAVPSWWSQDQEQVVNY